MLKKSIGIIILFIILSSVRLHSQVTIGSVLKPNEGALLDLKEDDGSESNSTRGLHLPIVELSDLSKLIMGNNEIPKEENGVNQYLTHTGLLVYNVSPDFCQGLYIWTGAKWDSLLECEEENPEADYTVNCTAATVNGTYTVGNLLDPSNTIDVTITAAKAGTANITSSTGGMTFTSGDILLSTGSQIISLEGSGTPTTAGSNSISINGLCNVNVNVKNPVANYTVNCTAATANGTYTVGNLLDSSNTIDVTITASKAGTANITSSTGGMTFTSGDILLSTGNQVVSLKGSGTPTTVGSNLISINGLCNVNVNVKNPEANYTVDCSAATVNGTYMVNNLLDSSNTISLTIVASKAGTANITSSTGGMTFTSGDILLSTGNQVVSLKGSGTPTTAGSNPISINGLCNVNVNVVPEKEKVSISTSKDALKLLASGRDLAAIGSDQLVLTWEPANGAIRWTSPSPNLELTITPDLETASSPTTVTITPNAIPFDEVIANPFILKESKFAFQIEKDGEVIESDFISIKQLNKAFSLATTNEKNESTSAVTKTNTIKGNVNWRIKSMTANSTISNIKLDGQTMNVGNTTSGWDLDNGTSKGSTGNLTYTIQGGASKSRFSTVIFEDASSTKRANDIQLTVFQCAGLGAYPKMNEWALVAGFVNVLDASAWKSLSAANRVIADAKAAIDTPNPNTGIAWHRDQDGNVFLSSSFDPANKIGDTNRWMITNLAATSYATGTRTGTDTSIPVTLRRATYTSGTKKYAVANNIPYFTEAISQDTRAGMLYNWAGATNSQGGSNGLGGYSGLNGPKTQGICPNGWHLPTDDELTSLEYDFMYDGTSFSSISSNPGGVLSSSTTGARGSTARNGHGNAMKEGCMNTTGYNNLVGLSNTINTSMRPGFETLLVGQVAHNGGYEANGEAGILMGSIWASSGIPNTTGGSTASAYYRAWTTTYAGVVRNTAQRTTMYNVRCKKD